MRLTEQERDVLAAFYTELDGTRDYTGADPALLGAFAFLFPIYYGLVRLRRDGAAPGAVTAESR